ncbi:hypothetical protein WICPIJ_003808 [Wickerhamomyces pijperi]|uniref:Uncharacterized protein n=1 Tax=Wickerhamomyces pijperi TaxID=599730 RepID=A0A9P8Q998_WICPI|nr:hypothetical protein WICPIJ_003808 [Wickerhamomyces pijperi]
MANHASNKKKPFLLKMCDFCVFLRYFFTGSGACLSSSYETPSEVPVVGFEEEKTVTKVWIVSGTVATERRANAKTGHVVECSS